MIIDTNRRVTEKLACLNNADVSGIIRYYARFTRQPEKRLTRKEAEAIVSAGMNIGIVHQSAGDRSSYFNHANGLLDGAYARNNGAFEIGQPDGSAIYFAVDYDADQEDIDEGIVPYFQAIRDTFQPSALLPEYKVGVYGNGLVCEALLNAGLASYAWLSQSTGHRGSREFKDSGRWTLFQNMPSSLCGIGIDRNDLNPNADEFGSFGQLEDPMLVVASLEGGQPPAPPSAGGAGASGDFDEAAFIAYVGSLGLKHFKPYELLVMGSRHSDPDSPCRGKNTRPPRKLWENIGPTIKVLDQLRARLGAPIRILNVYRSPAYNACIGGAPQSEHMNFRAVDFMAEGNSRPADWARLLRSMRDDEGLFHGGVGLYSSFVHVDTGRTRDWSGG